RARHAVYENARVLEAADALEEGRLERFGELLNESHLSLQFDYESTGMELDCLAELAWQREECLGARVTGAGFGGSAVALVRRDGVEDFCCYVGERYRRYIGYDCSFFRSESGDGARRV
ncbi:MAG: galactokinase, partial [Synergistaceae bacterium]|nr:galactokinase [Synergistaceae bacterium]